MPEEAWQSVDVIGNLEGEPHVLQQKVEVYGGERGESAGYAKPTVQHRLVALTELTSADWNHSRSVQKSKDRPGVKMSSPTAVSSPVFSTRWDSRGSR